MRKTDRSNIIKLNRAARFNSVVIIFSIILIYVIASIVISISKEPITTYKVGSSNINNNIKCTGIALRNEQEVTSSKSGYLIYFVRDGDKIKKGTPVCTVDETGNIIASIKEAGENDEGNELFSDKDYAYIRDVIDSYKASYSDVKFNNLYNFKSEVESKVMELSSQVMMSKIHAGGTAVSSTLQTIKASESGVVTYYLDGYEKKTPETLSEDDFNTANYKKTSLTSGDILDTGSTVYKLIADENWHIVCEINKDQAAMLEEEESIRFTINGSSNEYKSTFTLISKGNDMFYLDISLNKYMVDYINERFLNIEIILNKIEGLKVPNSALLEKEVYKIPKDYILEEEDAFSKTVNIIRYDEDATSSDAEEQNIELIIYKTDEDFYYVDKDAFKDTDQVYSKDKKKTTPVLSLERDNLTGVFLANAGIADFMEVEIIKSQDEFTIVNNGENLKEFDNVVLDASQVDENQTLY